MTPNTPHLRPPGFAVWADLGLRFLSTGRGFSGGVGARLGQSDTVRSPAGPQGHGKSPQSLPQGENGVSGNLKGFRNFSPQNSNGFYPKCILFSHESVSGGVVPGAHNMCAPDAPCPGPFLSCLDACFGPKPIYVKIRCSALWALYGGLHLEESTMEGPRKSSTTQLGGSARGKGLYTFAVLDSGRLL